jgi:hypothetical protein
MHMLVKALSKVATRYAPSRTLSFDVVHIFITLQMIENNGHVSRTSLCKELALGEGVIKTLVKHLKMDNLIETSNGGTRMTARGKAICSELMSSIPSEIVLPKCGIALGKFNHAVLVKSLGYSIKSGIEQRDAAIKIGGTGATTLLFRDNRFIMPATTTSSKNDDSLKNEPNIRKLLLEKLKPEEGDVIIIGSSDKNRKIAELAAKNAALLTIVSHERHD